MQTSTQDSVAFARLSDDQMACVGEIGDLIEFEEGDFLFQAGEKNFPFYVIAAGEAEIVESSTGEPRHVVTHGQGEFTGDVDLLTGRPSVVSCTARAGCSAYRLTAAQLRQLLGEIPALSDMLLRAFQTRRRLLEESGFLGIRVVGSAREKDTLELREFFYKNHVPFTFFDIAEPAGQEQLALLQADADDAPIIACHQHVVAQPSLGKVAECLGISRDIKQELYDLTIVGAGPAGLAAAVYGATEGLKTLVVDRMGPGGQAGQSSRIENYMGFPEGLSGAELANRGYLQALKFGAEFTAPVSVLNMCEDEQQNHCLSLCTGQQVKSRTVLVSTGVSYRRLPVEGCQHFEGAGIYYSATSVEARVCRDSTAVVVGGGNSAGQAAMYLSEFARDVKLLIRGDDLSKSMSAYLHRRIDMQPNIELLANTEVHAFRGDDCLRHVELRNNRSDKRLALDCSGLFIFIGAKPHTGWLPEEVALDERGFILTGPAAAVHELWQPDRAPCELESTLPGVFAAGDVRAGTTKRCAFAVGDGALAVTCVHQHLS